MRLSTSQKRLATIRKNWFLNRGLGDISEPKMIWRAMKDDGFKIEKLTPELLADFVAGVSRPEFRK